MKIAIDIDGTLTAWPKHFLRLMYALSDEYLHEDLAIVLLTGHSAEQPDLADRAALVAGRVAQLDGLGKFIDQISGPLREHDIVICVGRNSDEVAQQKADYCRNNKVDIFIDDSRNYCEAVRRESPGTLVLWVHP